MVRACSVQFSSVMVAAIRRGMKAMCSPGTPRVWKQCRFGLEGMSGGGVRYWSNLWSRGMREGSMSSSSLSRLSTFSGGALELSSGVFLPQRMLRAFVVVANLNLHESPGRKVLRSVQLSMSRFRIRATIVFAVAVAS